ncbi:ribonuclease J [Geothrix sp. PMB-07]|uniref:ribonuclease J n=1 Tax=Geothrix sp. PMB-07 TaxID=3068640 RepID=UPI0027420DA4|nr:ribonuclease J [Geothrix sp. PMB-07]WLT32911.1 ribonuclease J [Geothrix sp. PMB-07]
MPVAPEFEAWTEAPAAGELRLIPIGGLGEFGMNALVVHDAQSLFLVDCGQLFPSDDQPGIDSIVPDFAYLEPFADRLQAVLLTHGHEDHIGALPYFLRRWPVPVYGTAFTLGLVEGKLREHGLDPELLRSVKDYGRVKVGDIEAEWIPVTHSIPDACALALHTPQGVLVHSGDFKLDPEPLDGRLTGLERLQALGDAGVRLLMADSTNVGRPGRSPSESVCREGLEAAFEQTKGRLFVATFSSNIHRLQTLVDLAYEFRRRVVILGRSLDRNMTLARSLKHLHLPDDILVDAKDAHLFDRDELLVLCTGSQGEPMSGLARLLRREVKGLPMEPGDRLVVSARAIPGNEVAISRMLDDAERLGAETSLEGLGPVHASGHGSRDELADLIRAVRPNHMVPVHGTYRNLRAHGALAASLGWPSERISLLDGGLCLRLLEDGQVDMVGAVPVGKCFVHEGVDHMVDARVVKDRLILQEDGVVFATLLVDPQTGELAANPTILSRGFVMLSDDDAYADLLAGVARQAYEQAPAAVRADGEALRDTLRLALRRIIRKTTQTRPLVIPVILEAPQV